MSVIHKNDPSREDTVVFNPKNIVTLDAGTTTAEDANKETFEIFPFIDKDAAGAERISLVRVLLNAVPGTQRVSETDMKSYLGVRVSGPPGGPQSTIIPSGEVIGNSIYFDLRGARIKLMDVPSEYVGKLSGHGIAILAADERFFVFYVGATLDELAAVSSRLIFVADRVAYKWKEISVPGSLPRSRLLGPWFVSMEGQARTERRSETTPSEEGETAEVRAAYETFEDMVDIPGVLILDNLVDGRRIVLKTGKEDSEVLAANSDGVVYRINDEIYEAVIAGSSLAHPKLLAKGTEVPSVHWAFARQ